MNQFKNLQTINAFSDVFQDKSLVPVPESWYIVITDVVGSTKAIEAGKYKEVNISGGLAVMAVTNAFKDMEFPFVFGGDGVTFLVPPEISENVKDILYDTRDKIQHFYDLELRVGIVPIKDLYNVGKTIKFGKFRVSQYYDQAILDGTGVDKAEEWVKTPNSKYLILEKKDQNVEADFTGFSCRWQDINSHKGETIALIIKAKENKLKDFAKYYKEITAKIENIIGKEEDFHPIREDFLKLAPFRFKYLKNEAMANSKKGGFWQNFTRILRITMEIIVTYFIIRFRLSKQYGYYDIKKIKNYNVISSDFRKYDGTLKMIVAISPENRKKLEKMLEEEYEKGFIFYGLHVTNRSLITCLLHQSSEREVHFIDAADGGYALAAKKLKTQMKSAS